MSWIIPQNRDLWRFRAPLSADEIRRTERWLATARVALTIASLVTMVMEPVRGYAYSRGLYWLMTVYLAHAVVVMVLVRVRPRSTLAFRLVVHGAEIVWPTLISMFAPAQRGQFFLFFVFVMAEAAYRWGLWETVSTAVAAVALLWIEATVMQAGLAAAIDRWLAQVHWPPLGISMQELNPQQLIMSSVYLLVLGFLLGYMAQNQKKIRAERAVITRVLSSTRVEEGLTGTMQQILGEVMAIYGARRVMSASQEAHSYRVFLAEMNQGTNGNQGLRWREAAPESAAAYLFESRGGCVLHNPNPGRFSVGVSGSPWKPRSRREGRFSGSLGASGRISCAGLGFFGVRERMVGPRISVRSAIDGRGGRGSAVSTGIRATSWSRNL